MHKLFKSELEINVRLYSDDMDWVDLAQDKDQWRVLVNTVMNLQVP
jgi:hypothetical protein